MHRTRFAASALLLTTVVPLAACGGGGTSTVAEDCEPIVADVQTAEEGKLTAAVQEYPPYVSMAGDELSGVDGVLIAEVAERLCLEPEVQVTSITAVVESVRNGSADLTAGNWYINEERGREFELSDPVYIDQMALLTADGATSLDQLEGKTVGTPQGYLWVEDLQSVLGSQVKLYASEQAVYQDVRSGRTDAGVVTYGAAKHLVESNDDSELQVELMEPDERVEASVGQARTAVLVHKGRTQLRDAVNQVVEEMRADGSLEQALEEAGLPASAADVQAAS
ncbi:substrate-binding periplasmic protein [Kocuria nitroreducens]|uniref:substrate-binding periplasmic protein n=1 Tax=Kocuria nitroreducens TaxID=3058914 RepID=UPI0036DA794B